jgi:hypothetical protein
VKQEGGKPEGRSCHFFRNLLISGVKTPSFLEPKKPDVFDQSHQIQQSESRSWNPLRKLAILQ